ncbi:Plexin-B [Holothuria leucospilota]|uniref:Plexin-B n=1 Tax=Holothuria leucospilota TaxID=206669 RepID=A0A9Q1HIR4_HOLLE|nr:Plexin-B [Holothuria leucospilota]
MQAYHRMSRKMKGTRISCFMVLFISFCGGLCQQCGNPNSADASVYVENSFLSLEMENKPLTLLTVHSDNIYTAGNNGIFHLSQDLEVESRHVTEREENIYKILEVSESLDKLVACSSGGNRGCQLRNLGDVSVNSSSTNTALHENIVASGEFRTVGMIAPERAGEGSSLYVARSIDLNGDDGTVRPIFERKLMGSGNDDRQTNHMSASVKASFVIYYSDVFSYGGFVYYLASQRDDATREDASSPIVSKLSRICQNDESEEFKAFAELQLACTGEDGSLYSITQSAQQIGNELFIVFSKNGEELHEYNPQPQSALCVYYMTEIEDKFEENSYACACNGGYSEDNGNNVYLSRSSCGLLFIESPGFPGCDILGEDIGDIRDKFSCAANIGSTKFFAYPEEPQGQVVSADTLYESLDMTFSSLSVTSVPRDESQRIAFIGTKEGKLLKVHLGRGICGNYEVVDIGSPILGGTTLYNNNESLLVLTKSKLLKIKVADCSLFTNCEDCIRPGSPLGDPYCGWCTLERRCTRYEECSDYSEVFRWLTNAENECTAIAQVTPESIPVENHSQQLQLKVTNLPELNAGEYYECHFNDWITQAIIVGNFINCTSPPMDEIPEVVTGDHVIMQLDIFASETGKRFVSRDYLLYNCSRIGKCSNCVTRWECDWCVFDHKCTHNSSSCKKVIHGATGLPSDNSSDSCPQIIPGEGIFVPNGVDQSISFQAKNLPPLDYTNVMSYRCHLVAKDNCCFEVDFVAGATLRTVDNTTFKVTCDSKAYSYSLKGHQTFDTKLLLKWNERNLVDNYQPVQLYKCEVERPDCSRCLSNTTTPRNLNCVWCESTCTVEGTCDGTPTSPVMGTCPAPQIDMVNPPTSTLGGGTLVKITGSNLGQSFEDIESIILAGQECKQLEDSYMVGESITCKAGPANEVTDAGDVLVRIGGKSGSKANCFSYKDPQITAFFPSSGPQSGGTRVEIMGQDLDTGRHAEVSFGDVPCLLLSSRTADNITCKTEAAKSIFTSKLNVTFDKTESKTSRNYFLFDADPTVTSIEPQKTIMSGGTYLTVTGRRFHLIQGPQIVATTQEGSETFENCLTIIDTELQCLSPKLYQGTSSKRLQMESTPEQTDVGIGFLLDGVISLKNWTEDNDITFHYFADPTYEPFSNDEIFFHQGFQEFIQIMGENINVATSEEDVTVYIGREECKITVFDEDQIYCTPPAQQPAAGDKDGNRTDRGLPFVVVMHGRNLKFNLGYLRYTSDPTIFVIITIAFVFLLIACLFPLTIRRVWKNKTKEVELLFLELRDVRTNINEELRIFYDTLQNALDKFETCNRGKESIEMVDRSQYVTNVVFGRAATQENTVEKSEMVMLLSDAMKTFSELIKREDFLIAIIHIVDEDADISDEQRANIASLILVGFLLEGKIEYISQVMKIVISKKIENADDGRSKRLFHGNKSVAETLFYYLISLCLYDRLRGEAAEKILELYWAIKSIIESGPIDAVTGKTQFSLSLSHMLEDQIKFEEVKLEVLFKAECDQAVEITFLSVDSITQVKSKILDYFCQAQRTPLHYWPEEFDLILCNNEGEKRILRDNSILKLQHGWRKINMLSDFEIQSGECVELVKRVYERKYYSSCTANSSLSENNDLLEPNDGYLIPDVNQAGASTSDINTLHELHDRSLVAEVHQAEASISQNNEVLDLDGDYTIPDEDQEIANESPTDQSLEMQAVYIPHSDQANSSLSENNDLLEPNDGYLIPDVNQEIANESPTDQSLEMQAGYLILDSDQANSSLSENNDLLEPNDGYLIPDVNQEIANESPTDQSLEMQAGYLILDSDQEGSRGYEDMDPYSRSDIKYYYPDGNHDDHSIYDEPEAGFGLWIWHLIKDDKIMHNTSRGESTDEDNVKDIVRPYLPATGSVIKKYIRDLFDAFMTRSETHVPQIIKDIFDFFDKKAMDRQAPELAKAWKNNILFRGIYSTLLRKPALIYDVKEYSYVQACLEVVAQTLEKVCTDENGGHDDPSSRNHLFSQLVPVYQAKLDQFYTQIKKTRKAQPETLKNEYTKLEKDFAGTFDLVSVQFHLYTMLKDHIDQMSEELDADANLIGKLRFIQTAVKEIEERSTTMNISSEME